MARWARWTALMALPAALVVSSCSSAPADPVPTAVVAPVADCMSPDVLDDLGLVPAAAEDAQRIPTASAAPGRVPDDFVPVSVVVCTPDGSLHDAAGTWLALTASHREGDLEPLVAALRKPSARREGTCSSAQVAAAAPSALWLVDALGRALRPTWPTDHCGVPSSKVSKALAKLEETDSVKYPVRPTP
ncbi:hypothetical protein [Cellulomonas sp. URHD0024]|uniref:hypothetical protein n=1 Tax=Cellulomonas sp. URHD0024 TaxID=1302620 RepID=UPI0012DC4A0B|nr:hypothetical protein [Cellulomonas sp. URHD0024]